MVCQFDIHPRCILDTWASSHVLRNIFYIVLSLLVTRLYSAQGRRLESHSIFKGFTELCILIIADFIASKDANRASH